MRLLLTAVPWPWPLAAPGWVKILKIGGKISQPPPLAVRPPEHNPLAVLAIDDRVFQWKTVFRGSWVHLPANETSRNSHRSMSIGWKKKKKKKIDTCPTAVMLGRSWFRVSASEQMNNWTIEDVARFTVNQYPLSIPLLFIPRRLLSEFPLFHVPFSEWGGKTKKKMLIIDILIIYFVNAEFVI